MAIDIFLVKFELRNLSYKMEKLYTESEENHLRTCL
jgi:hypothetical protein